MDANEARFQHGATLLARAVDDPDLLGMALLLIHGVVEQILRQRLAGRSDLDAESQQLLRQQASGGPLLAMVRRYEKLEAHELDLLNQANQWRRLLARGEPSDVLLAEVQQYAQFAARLSGFQRAYEAGLANGHQLRQVAARPSYTAPWALLTPLILLAVLAAMLWAVVDLSEPGRFMTAVGLAPAPTVTPGPEPTPLVVTPPQLPSARIVRLGGGPGWLHELPRFDSPTLPIRLSEGMVVTLRDAQQTDTQGNLWQLVAVDGYEGWSPINNVEPIP